MDRLRLAAETAVRRVAGIGLLLVATIAGLLSPHPSLALDATAILLTLEALLLTQFGIGAPPPMPLPVWLSQPGRNRRPGDLYAALLAENFRLYGRRLSIPAGAAWIADLVSHLSR